MSRRVRKKVEIRTGLFTIILDNNCHIIPQKKKLASVDFKLRSCTMIEKPQIPDF
jgi:hypothetical protein